MTRFQLSFVLFAIFGFWLCASNAADSTYATIVKSLIDNGTCNDVTTTSICGNDSRAYSYYETFVYNNRRVVIVSGVPGHDAEYDQAQKEPNTRCVRYQYFTALGTKTSSFTASMMSSIAFMTSGATLFSALSGTDGSLASYYQWDTLDPCYGHSDASKQYHYHAASECISGSTDASKRTLIGYMTDGLPLYGYATNDAGVTLKSCWKSNVTDPSNMANFSYDTDGYNSGSCHLDKANGYTFSDAGYGYVMVSENYYTPYYMAGKIGRICGFTP